MKALPVQVSWRPATADCFINIALLCWQQCNCTKSTKLSRVCCTAHAYLLCLFAGARGHDLYLDMLQKLINDPDSFPDTSVVLQNSTVLVHRFLLAARLPHIGVWCCTCTCAACSMCLAHFTLQEYLLAIFNGTGHLHGALARVTSMLKCEQ